MAQAIIGALRAELSAGAARFAEDMGKAGDSVQQFGRRFQRTGASVARVGRKMSLAVTAPIAAMGTLAVRSFQAQEKAVAAVDAALASMGDKAGFTSQQLQAMAAEMQGATTFGDEEILDKVTANLLTFGNIQDDVFRRAQQNALDLSARLGQDLQSSAVMLGKALNDPATGLTALTRVGVAFTEEQKEMIKAMTEAGDVAGAQAIMLDELEKQYGGQAAAMASTSQGEMQQLANAWGDFQEVIGGIIVDMLPPLLNMLRDLVTWLQQLDPKTVAWGVAIAGAAAAIGPLVLAIGGTISALGGLISVMGMVMKAGPAFAAMAKLIGAAIATMGGPITLAITAVAALAAAWLMYGDEIRAYVSRLIEAVDQALGGRLSMIFDAIIATLQFFAEQFKLVFTMLGQLLTGDFSGALESLKQLWSNVWGAAINIVGNAVGEIGNWLKGKLGAIMDWVGNKLETMKQGFKNLYQAVVGGSYVPDMVDDIIAEMQRLEGGFVQPALDMTTQVGDSFASLGQRMGSIFDELVNTGTVSMQSLVGVAASAMDKWLNVGTVMGNSPGGGGSLVGVATSIFGAAFGGGLATGGLAMAGRPYMVGERGPELFRPHVTGTVDPDGSRGGGVTQVFNVTTPDADSFRRSERQIMRSARQKLMG